MLEREVNCEVLLVVVTVRLFLFMVKSSVVVRASSSLLVLEDVLGEGFFLILAELAALVGEFRLIPVVVGDVFSWGHPLEGLGLSIGKALLNELVSGEARRVPFVINSRNFVWFETKNLLTVDAGNGVHGQLVLRVHVLCRTEVIILHENHFSGISVHAIECGESGGVHLTNRHLLHVTVIVFDRAKSRSSRYHYFTIL